MDVRRLISTREAARRLHCHPTTVKKACREGRLAAFRVDGGPWMIDPSSVRRYQIRPTGRPNGSRDREPRTRRWARRPE